MMKNITLSADETLLERARRRAATENITLNALFREWLQRYVVQPSAASEYVVLMKQLDHIQAGRKFNREEMNER